MSGGAQGSTEGVAASVLSGGAETYGRSLAGAGGSEVHALTPGSGRPAIHAAIYASPPYELSVPPLPVSRLAVNLTPACVHGGLEGERSRSFHARRHSTFLTPAGAPVTWCKEAPSRHLMIYFQADAFDGALSEMPELAGAPALFNATIPGLGQLVDHFTGELQAPGIFYEEAADSLARLMLVRVVRHLHGKSACAHGLTPKALERVRDYVMEHLGERILVADLAHHAGLSPNRFALSFTKQTGQSPHRFVMAKRAERAVELLTRSQLSLAAIAADCGFANQQHMSNVVMKQLGMSPNRLRLSRRRDGGVGL
jgi:AraC family transcriptional regulator